MLELKNLLHRTLLAIGPSLPRHSSGSVSVIVGIVLQNSFLACVQIFPGALVRSLENYVGGHTNGLISNRPPL